MFDDPRSEETRDRDDWRERERDALDGEHIDPRDVFTEGLNLPRGLEREYVRNRGHRYEIRGSEARTLATVGAFRVVLSRDLHDHNGHACDPRKGDLRSLREQGLVRTVQLDGRRDVVVLLTKLGRDLLDSHRDRERDCGQTFYADLKKPREIEHDAQVFRAYLREDDHPRSSVSDTRTSRRSEVSLLPTGATSRDGSCIRNRPTSCLRGRAARRVIRP